jgi:hypothetical protein
LLPGLEVCSKSVTDAPPVAADIAAIMPEAPAPITATVFNIFAALKDCVSRFLTLWMAV